MTTKQKLLLQTIIKTAGYFLRKVCSACYIPSVAGYKIKQLKQRTVADKQPPKS